MITLIVAYDEERAIGKDGDIPWKLPEDMKHFKELTMGGTVIMGRKTWDSLPDRFKPLPGRGNIVLTRTPGLFKMAKLAKPPVGVLCAKSLEDAIHLAEGSEIFIIGGGEIYKYALAADLVDRIVASEVKGRHGGDVFFPRLAEGWGRTFLEKHNGFTIMEYSKFDTPFEAAHAACDFGPC